MKKSTKFWTIIVVILFITMNTLWYISDKSTSYSHTIAALSIILDIICLGYVIVEQVHSLNKWLDVHDHPKQKYYSTDQVIKILTDIKGVNKGTDIVIDRIIPELERQRPK